MKKSKRKTIRVASLVIHRANDMTPQGRKDIAEWLHAHARWLLKHGKDYSPRFTAGCNR